VSDQRGRSAIRQLAGSYAGPLVVAGEFENTAHIWNLQTADRVRTIEAKFDYGGKRLAISPDGKMLFTGAWARYGIAAYSISDGQQVWRRTELKNVQALAVDAAGDRLICSFDRSPTHLMDPKTGVTLETLRGVEDLYNAPFSKAVVQVSRQGKIWLRGPTGKKISIPATSFAVLAVEFGAGEVCISEVGGPVRCFDIETGEERWRHTPRTGLHFLNLGFDIVTSRFAGVSWAYKTGGEYFLEAFDGDGRATFIAQPDEAGAAIFCLKGSTLLTERGDLIDVATGRTKTTLDFPRLEDVGTEAGE
jgi:outer membrane protein assembly factor BamB